MCKRGEKIINTNFCFPVPCRLIVMFLTRVCRGKKEGHWQNPRPRHDYRHDIVFCEKKKTALDPRLRKKAQTYIRADPGVTWSRGCCVWCPTVAGAMVLSVVATTGTNRNFLSDIWPCLDCEIRFSSFGLIRGNGQPRHQWSWQRTFYSVGA